jgi:ribosome silencing factor RsfS/YbeB/iojap
MKKQELIKFLEDNLLKDIEYYEQPANWIHEAIIVTATSQRHIHSVISKLKEAGLIKSRSVEGNLNGEWVILNVGPIMLQIFTSETRNYYKLDELWQETIKWREEQEKKDEHEGN